MRRILEAQSDGKYLAIDNPDAVVVDHGAQMIRSGLDRWTVTRPTLWRFIAFMLRSADRLQEYPAICEATALTSCGRIYISQTAADAEPIFEAIGMTLETIDDVGLRLHSDPRTSLECCATLVPGQPLPSRVRSIRSGRGRPHTKPIPLAERSIRRTRTRSKASMP